MSQDHFSGTHSNTALSNLNFSVEDLLSGNRRALARAITLIESQKPDHQSLAQQLLKVILPHTGKAKRIGISGSPGVGKSTFIEALGLRLVKAQGLKVAVIAIDPSSPIAGGSILGDKTRMEQLAREGNAFIRPSPAGDALGGVAKRTREVMFLCEAAGYDVCIVETVGVGQSEYVVANMVDFFLLLLLPSAGDELQGIKRGIVELADGLVITKHDGDNKQLAEITQAHYQNALKLLRYPGSWDPQVLTSSHLAPDSISSVWDMLLNFWETMGHSMLANRRAAQNQHWMYHHLKDLLLEHIEHQPDLKQAGETIEKKVKAGKLSSFQAAQALFDRVLEKG